ncbi:MAG: DNA polymerase III subunit beta [Burkholderiales bacterium]|nr:DNA polymerase III subunit beta [Burkholderiales bacterium]
MKIIQADRETLLRPLQAITGIVERRHTLPILSNVLLERKHGKLGFIATDLEVQVTTEIPCNTEGEAISATVSARKLYDILRALPDGEKVTIDASDRKLQVKTTSSKFNLQTLSAEDFPRMAEASDSINVLTAKQHQLKTLLASVQYAMAQQDIRYYLNGMLMIADSDALIAVATDGHRLALNKLNHNTGTARQEVILPRKAVIELVKLLADSDDEVTIGLTEKQVKFKFSDIQLTSKVVDGKFPDYTRVIPTQNKNRIALSRMDLQRALQRAAILANEKFRGVRLMLTKDQLSIVCSNNEHEEAQEELIIDYSGEPLDIGFNITYLLDVLNSRATENIECALGDANSSALITEPGNGDFQYVVMPMRI